MRSSWKISQEWSRKSYPKRKLTWSKLETLPTIRRLKRCIIVDSQPRLDPWWSLAASPQDTSTNWTRKGTRWIVRKSKMRPRGTHCRPSHAKLSLMKRTSQRLPRVILSCRWRKKSRGIGLETEMGAFTTRKSRDWSYRLTMDLHCLNKRFKSQREDLQPSS